MFSTCIFCNKPLGANETLETFPVGKRLAFDAARGRLWVVCPACERWNLSPLDERWEAIEQAEKLQALLEEAERRAMEGELQALEAAWRRSPPSPTTSSCPKRSRHG